MPSYTDGEFTYWAYSATGHEYCQIDGVKYFGWDEETETLYTKEEFDGLDQTTKDKVAIAAWDEDATALYANAGFNVLFINWGATMYNPANGFEGSLVEKIMDWAWERNIKCFIYGPFHSLSASHTSLIVGEGKGNGTTTFDTQADLNEYAATQLEGVVDHPAFYGVSLIDEAYYTQFDAMGQVYQAVQSVKPGVFCNMNLNPMSYSWQAMERYCETSYNWVNVDGRTSGFTAAEMEASYVEYLNLYYEKVGKYCGYIGYDSYPMLNYSNNNFLYPHIRNAQLVAEYCAKYDMRFGHVYQTYKDSAATGRRALDEDDIEWQVNMGLAFGVKDHSYYTYYPVLNSGSTPDEDHTIVDRNGDPNDMYYWVKGLNEDMAVFAKAMAHFEYRDMQYYKKGTVDSSMQEALNIVENVGKFDDKLENVAISANGLALVTELYDEENGWFGYFVMNATNPYTTVATQTVTLTFAGYSNAQIYQDGVVKTVALTNGQVTLTLAEAAGAFVIPY